MNASSHSSNVQHPYDDQNTETQELKFLKGRIRQLDMQFEDFAGKLLVRSQDTKDMDRQIDAIFSDLTKFTSSID